MPTPPTPRSQRATRKPLLYRYLNRWYEPGLGLDIGEWMCLQAVPEYQRWLARGRLTDQMTVALIDYTLASLQDQLVNLAPSWSERIEWMTQALAGRSPRPGGHTVEEAECLAVLTQMTKDLMRWGGDRVAGSAPNGLTMYDAAPESVVREWARLQKRYPKLMKELADGVSERLDSTEEIKFGRHSPPIYLGARGATFSKLAALRGELGKKFLDRDAAESYRKACVRKWKQLAFARAARDQELDRARAEQNQRAREAYEKDGWRTVVPGAYLTV